MMGGRRLLMLLLGIKDGRIARVLVSLLVFGNCEICADDGSQGMRRVLRFTSKFILFYTNGYLI